MGLYSYEINMISKREWHDLLTIFSDVLIEQTWSYADLRWERGSLSHLVVKRNQEIVAAAQVVILSVPLINASIAFLKFGPLWQKHGKPLDPENLQQALSFIHLEYVVKRGCFMRIMPPALAFDSIETEHSLLSLGFKKTQILNPERYLVDLSPSIEDIRKSFKPRWRSALKKAERRDLEIIQLKGEEVLPMFMPLYDKMIKRKSFVDRSAISELPEIINDLPLGLKPFGLFCIYNGLCVGGVIISSIGDTALYLFGATGETGLELGAGFFYSGQ